MQTIVQFKLIRSHSSHHSPGSPLWTKQNDERKRGKTVTMWWCNSYCCERVIPKNEMNGRQHFFRPLFCVCAVTVPTAIIALVCCVVHFSLKKKLTDTPMLCTLVAVVSRYHAATSETPCKHDGSKCVASSFGFSYLTLSLSLCAFFVLFWFSDGALHEYNNQVTKLNSHCYNGFFASSFKLCFRFQSSALDQANLLAKLNSDANVFSLSFDRPFPKSFFLSWNLNWNWNNIKSDAFIYSKEIMVDTFCDLSKFSA